MHGGIVFHALGELENLLQVRHVVGRDREQDLRMGELHGSVVGQHPQELLATLAGFLELAHLLVEFHEQEEKSSLVGVDVGPDLVCYVHVDLGRDTVLVEIIAESGDVFLDAAQVFQRLVELVLLDLDETGQIGGIRYVQRPGEKIEGLVLFTQHPLAAPVDEVLLVLGSEEFLEEGQRESPLGRHGRRAVSAAMRAIAGCPPPRPPAPGMGSHLLCIEKPRARNSGCGAGPAGAHGELRPPRAE